MQKEKDDLYVNDLERYDTHSATVALLRLSYYAPLPLILKEIYDKRRLIVYVSSQTCQDFSSTISNFLFYDPTTIFISDKSFVISTDEYFTNVNAINDFEFEENDVFFSFDFNVNVSVIKYVKELKIKGMTVEVFRKPFLGSLIYYVKHIRPLKNLLAINPKLHVIMTDNFMPPHGDLTKWEQYLKDNSLTREKMVHEMKMKKDIATAYSAGFYPNEYSVEDIISMHTIPSRYMDEKGVYKFDDYKSQHVNVENGQRITIGQPQGQTRTMHIFGGCGLFGVGVPDKYTFASQLQKLFNEKRILIRVENRASFIWGKHDAMWYMINSTKFNENDIILIPFNPKWASYFYKNEKNVHYLDMGKREADDGEVFNDMWHPNINGLGVYARNVFKFLLNNDYLYSIETNNSRFVDIKEIKEYGIPKFANSKQKNKDDNNLLSENNLEKLNIFLSEISPKRQKIGSIIMNCNPFTLGHRYLIEYAAKQVNHLYVFVVEEDKSYFSFEDRFDLVKKGVKDLKNVTVLPSSKFMISSLTFNDYFGKAKIQDKKIDATMDVLIFAKYIAPTMGINIRFAGAEPLDKITRQYNETMAQILPAYGIKFEEIQRIESSGQVISASRVRKLLEKKDFEAISQIVPQTTYDYLVQRFNK